MAWTRLASLVLGLLLVSSMTGCWSLNRGSGPSTQDPFYSVEDPQPKQKQTTFNRAMKPVPEFEESPEETTASTNGWHAANP